MIPICRRLAAPLVGKQISDLRKPWQRNLADYDGYQGQQSKCVIDTLTKFSLHWHIVLPEFISLIVTLSNCLFGF